VSTNTLPRLLDQKSLAAELGVAMHTARSIMQEVPKIQVGRRVYVTAESVYAYLNREARS
jgi:hypothetical protein